MSIRALRIVFSVCLLLSFSALAFGQGLTWETTTTIQMGGDHKIESKSYYLPRMFKNGSDNEATIFRLDKEMLYIVNYEKKEYSEVRFSDLDFIVKQEAEEFASQMAEMKKHMESMPEEQRKMMEKMMGGASAGSSKVDVTKAPGTKTLAGFSCVNYQLKEDGKELGNIWTTTDVPGFAAMQKDFKEFSERLASQMTVKGPEMADAMQRVDGFPMLTDISGMKATVTKVSKAAIAKSEFEIPAGYKKVPFEGRSRKGRRGPGDGPMDEENHDEH